MVENDDLDNQMNEMRELMKQNFHTKLHYLDKDLKLRVSQVSDSLAETAFQIKSYVASSIEHLDSGKVTLCFK